MKEVVCGSEVSVLRSISPPVECPNCDGLIDLANVGEEVVYNCQYCGASGVLELKFLEQFHDFQLGV
jgi:DNA-directed RNA polymerase subunit RPC12/RpoP